MLTCSARRAYYSLNAISLRISHLFYSVNLFFLSRRPTTKAVYPSLAEIILDSGCFFACHPLNLADERRKKASAKAEAFC